MSFLRDIFNAPISWIYSGVVSVRHKLFECGALKTESFDIPIVCVGNITVGGTGKTPTTEYLTALLSKNYKVAVLSRGYKRKTKGFVLATTTTSFKRIGDEPKQIKLKFPNIPVAVCEKRVEGVKKIRQIHPEVNLIILDDAFQHRYIEPWVNILLMDYNNPIYQDHMLPLGRLRDLPSQIARAHIVMVTKCPGNITPLDLRIVNKNLDLQPYQHLFFTTTVSSEPQPLFPALEPVTIKNGVPAIVITAIANPKPFVAHIEEKYTLIHKLIFPDHYTFKMRDIHALEELIDQAPADTLVFVTEKDAVKLLTSKKIPEHIRRRLYYISICQDFVDGAEIQFQRVLSQYVRENQKHNIAHPQ